jgi:hypothetical protein
MSKTQYTVLFRFIANGMKYFLIAILFIYSVSAFGQVGFKGKLVNKVDQTPIEFAIIKSIDLGSFTQTNAEGEFKFPLPETLKTLRFEVSAIGLRDTITVKRTRKAIEIIYIDRPLLSLTPVTIKGLSAKETVKLAVDMIPANYTDSSYAAFSFWRQYDKVNGIFKNLIEAQTVILFKLTLDNNRFNPSYGYDVEQMRRSDFKHDVADFDYYQDDISYHMLQDPVYHLRAGALNPNAFNFYTFNFDTTNKTDDFVIKYSCKDFSSEEHGVSNLRDLEWEGEGTEEGRLVIDRKTYAFKKIERTGLRNNYFTYGKNNNWVIPSRDYYQEFVDGYLVSEYEQVKGKWFLTKMCHAYTNDFYLRGTTKKEFTITEAYEWYADSISHFIGPQLLDKFFNDTYLPSCNYTYDKEKWSKPLPPYYFYKAEDVYRDLEKKSPLEEQFENNGKQTKSK